MITVLSGGCTVRNLSDIREYSYVLSRFFSADVSIINEIVRGSFPKTPHHMIDLIE